MRSRAGAALFGGGEAALRLTNPIASDLDCMRPSILPNLIEAAARNARQGFADAALFEVGPTFAGDEPGDQRSRSPRPRRRRTRRGAGPSAGADRAVRAKADLMALLDELGAPTAAGRRRARPRPGGTPAARPGCSSGPRPWSPSSASCIRAC